MIKNLTLLADFYEFTMSQGYFDSGHKDTIVTFDMFFRKVPDNGGYAIFAGLEQFIEYLSDLKFEDDDIEYLRSKKIFSEGFLEYLKNLNARSAFNVLNKRNSLRSLKLLFKTDTDGSIESKSIIAIGVIGYKKKEATDFLSFISAVISRNK